MVQLTKKLIAFSLVLQVSLLGALESHSSRIQKLEEEVQTLQGDLQALLVEQRRPNSNPGIMRDEWFVTLEPLYWYQRTNGTAFAYSNHTTVATLPLRGRTKDLDFGWSWGLRAGVGKNIGFDKWDLLGTFTVFRSHASGTAHAGQNSSLIPLRGSVITQTPVTRAKSGYDLHLYTLDLELGRHYYVSERLSFRPFIGVKNAWLNQAQVVRYTGGSLGHNSAHINDDCEYWGIGIQGGLGSRWHLGSSWYLAGAFSGAILYGFFDVEHREKVTPSAQDRIKLEDNKHRFVPVAEWRLGLGYGTYFNQKELYLDLGLYYEGMYWWRQNQMLRVYEYTALRYDNFSEDLSMHGLTISARLYF